MDKLSTDDGCQLSDMSDQGLSCQAPVDRFGRRIDYLRISVTDMCNFRCGYCYVDDELLPRQKVMTLEEIGKVAEIAAGIGFKTVKLTGGEPLLRKNIGWLIKQVSNFFEDSSITTNGFNLSDNANMLKEFGMSRVTVSLDSLKKDNFEKICGKSDFNYVMEGIEKVIDVFGEVKINTVLIKGINDEEIDDFIKLALYKPVHLRFIELVSKNGYRPVPTAFLKDAVKRKIKLGKKVTNGRGPAISYEVENGIGTVGFISLNEQAFCKNCNRLRIKVNGSVKPCLYNKKEISFLEQLRKGNLKEVENVISRAINEKPEKHGALVTQMRVNGG